MTSPRTTQGGRPPFRRGGRRRRQCYCKESTVDYKDVSSIRRFITDRGRIEAGNKSGNCAKCQRNLTTAIKRARHLALLPYAPDHLRVTGAVTTGGKISNEEEKTTDETSESAESVEATTSTEETTVEESSEETEAKEEETPVAEAASEEPEAEEETEAPADDVSTDESSEADEETEAPADDVSTDESSEADEETEAPADDVSTDESSEADDAADAEVNTDEEDK